MSLCYVTAAAAAAATAAVTMTTMSSPVRVGRSAAPERPVLKMTKKVYDFYRSRSCVTRHIVTSLTSTHARARSLARLQVKIIVPNTTAGLVIGKAGATIKTIMEESGSKVMCHCDACDVI